MVGSLIRGRQTHEVRLQRKHSLDNMVIYGSVLNSQSVVVGPLIGYVGRLTM
jgi:hypothetical protein